MSAASPQFRTTLSLTEMEELIRRVVRETVHEELARLLRQAPASISEDWTHEGPAESADDQRLLAEAQEQLEHYQAQPEAWMAWGAFKAELIAAEAAGELPVS